MRWTFLLQEDVRAQNPVRDIPIKIEWGHSCVHSLSRGICFVRTSRTENDTIKEKSLARTGLLGAEKSKYRPERLRGGDSYYSNCAT